MVKSQDIYIPAPSKGIAQSPYVGNGRVQNLEIFQIPGVCKIKYRTVSNLTPNGLVIAFQRDTHGNIFAATNTGYLYQSVDGGTTWTNVSGTTKTAIYDMKVWQDYLFITRSGTIDVVGPLSFASPKYSQNWKTAGVDSNGYNLAIQPITGGSFMYIANGNNVGTITSFVAGDVITSPTATWNPTAIPLQSGEYARTLGLLGRNLLIGTQCAGNNFSQALANVYPYDLGTLTLGYPIFVEENGINQMFVYNNLAYVHAGIYGNIYRTNGSSVEFYKNVAPYNRLYGTNIAPYSNAINYVNNELLIGTSTGADGFPSNSIHGIYSIKDGTKYLNFRTISTENVGANQTLQIGAILPIGADTLLIGWQDGTTFGLDSVDQRTYQNFSAFFESEVQIVAEPENNNSYDDAILYLTQPLIATQKIQVQWRDGLTDPWNTIKDVNGQAYFDITSGPTGATALFAKSTINNVNTVQVKIAFSQPLTIGNYNIPFLGLKLKRHTNG